MADCCSKHFRRRSPGFFRWLALIIWPCDLSSKPGKHWQELVAETGADPPGMIGLGQTRNSRRRNRDFKLRLRPDALVGDEVISLRRPSRIPGAHVVV